MKSEVLRLENIYKHYNGHTVLNNISLVLYESEIHALIGENGAGKSSLMRITAGLETKDSGEIYLYGRKIAKNGPHLAKKNGISIIVQDSQLIPHLNVLENISLTSWQSLSPLPIINWKKTKDVILEIMERLNLPLDLHAKASELSFAEQKIVELIRALHQQAQILILDEITSPFTEIETKKIFRIIKSIKEKGTSVFFISHKISEVFSVADRATIIRDGSIIDSYAINQVQNKGSFIKNAIHEMVGDTLYNRYPKITTKAGYVSLSTKNLSTEYLDNINIKLHKSEIVGVTGLMGSGRTRLAETLFGLNPKYRGLIAVNNKPVVIKNPLDAIACKICYMPESHAESLFSNLSLSENLTLSNPRSVTESFLIDIPLEQKIMRDYIDRLGIKFTKEVEKVGNFSTGNKQKVLFAMGLNQHARIFLLDEPTKGLDIASKVEVYNIMNEIVLSGGSVLFISSDFKELLGMCDRIYVLKKGCIVTELNSEEMSEEHIIYYSSSQLV